jgi:hypothetical protein
MNKAAKRDIQILFGQFSGAVYVSAKSLFVGWADYPRLYNRSFSLKMMSPVLIGNNIAVMYTSL